MMLYSDVVKKVETLNPSLLQEAYNYILNLHKKQEQSKHKQRKFGILEGKMSVKFSDDWTITDEEMLGL